MGARTAGAPSPFDIALAGRAPAGVRRQRSAEKWRVGDHRRGPSSLTLRCYRRQNIERETLCAPNRLPRYFPAQGLPFGGRFRPELPRERDYGPARSARPPPRPRPYRAIFAFAGARSRPEERSPDPPENPLPAGERTICRPKTHPLCALEVLQIRAAGLPTSIGRAHLREKRRQHKPSVPDGLEPSPAENVADGG